MNQDERKELIAKINEANSRADAAEIKFLGLQKKIGEYEAKAKEAERANRMKSLFLANMSHEIRTPLNAIEGFSRVMCETESQEERMKYMEIIESNNSRLLTLINEILDLSRVEAGEVSIKKSLTDLNELCRTLNNTFKFRCPDTVNMVWEEPNMTVMLNTDGNRISQVFSNLISNALKHTTQGSISYGYRLINDGQDVEFYVSDTGSGIDPQDIDNIFKTYVSKDADFIQNGFGLGLPLSKIIVEKLGGTISVSSKLGQGSTFRFTIPFDGSVGGLAKNSRITTNSRTIRVSTHGNLQDAPLILVAEDEDNNYELVKVVLSKRYRLLRAHNGIEAVTFCEDEHPDLILMDIQMPVHNGYEAAEEIRRSSHPQAKTIPIVAMTANAFDEDVKHARASGMNDHLAKPIDVTKLYNTLARYLHSHT